MALEEAWIFLKRQRPRGKKEQPRPIVPRRGPSGAKPKPPSPPNAPQRGKQILNPVTGRTNLNIESRGGPVGRYRYEPCKSPACNGVAIATDNQQGLCADCIDPQNYVPFPEEEGNNLYPEEG